MDSLPDGVVALIAGSLSHRERIRALLVCKQWWPALLRNVSCIKSMGWLLSKGHTEHLTLEISPSGAFPNNVWAELETARGLRSLRIDSYVDVWQLRALRENNPRMEGSLHVWCPTMGDVRHAAADPSVETFTMSCCVSSEWVPDALRLVRGARRVFIRGGWFEDDQAARLVDALGDVSFLMDEFMVNIDCSLSMLCDFFKRVKARAVTVEFKCYCVSTEDILSIVDAILSNENIKEVRGDSMRCMMDYTLALTDTPDVVIGAMRRLLPKAGVVLATNYSQLLSHHPR